MSQLNLIIGPTQPQEFDAEKEKEEARERKKYLLKTLEDKFKVGSSYFYRFLSLLEENYKFYMYVTVDYY